MLIFLVQLQKKRKEATDDGSPLLLAIKQLVMFSGYASQLTTRFLSP